jgi:hypothetical protein
LHSGTPGTLRPPSRADATMAESRAESSAQGAAAKKGRKGRPLILNKNYLNDYPLFSRSQEDSQTLRDDGTQDEEQEQENQEQRELNERLENVVNRKTRSDMRRVTFTDIAGGLDRETTAVASNDDTDDDETVLTPELTQDREILQALDNGVEAFGSIVKTKPEATRNLLIRMCH